MAKFGFVYLLLLSYTCINVYEFDSEPLNQRWISISEVRKAGICGEFLLAFHALAKYY